MDDEEANRKFLALEQRILHTDSRINDVFQGEDFRFKALWFSLPLCLAIFGAIQYFNAKSNNDYIDKYVQDAKEKIKDQEKILSDNIRMQDKKISEIINTARDGNLTSITISTVPKNDPFLKAYPHIYVRTLDDSKKYYQVSFISYVVIKSNPGERGYLIASAYKWGGGIAEKFAVNRYNKFDPSFSLNESGYQSQYSNESLITEYGYTASYTLNVDRSTCIEARKVISELQQAKTAGWIDITMIMRKIENKPESKRYEISVGEIVQDCE